MHHHIAQAISRLEEGLPIYNSMLWETKAAYPQEFAIALEVLSIVHREPAEQASAKPVAAFFDLLPGILDRDLSLPITHPGYVDAELLDISSYSVIRARDTQLMTDPRVLRALADAGVELVTYSTATLDGVPLREA